MRSTDSLDRDSSEPEDRQELLREKVAGAREEQDEADTAMLAATDKRLAEVLGAQGLRVLRMFEHTIQGISLDVTLSVYQKMNEIKLAPGEVLFRANGEAADGMYVLTSGELEIFAENSSHVQGSSEGTSAAHKELHTLLPALKHVYQNMFDEEELADQQEEEVTPNLLTKSPMEFSSKRRYLCTFRNGQSIGENALLEGPGATRAVTAVAGNEGAEMLQINDELFAWLADQYPQAIISFILITTSRQWRVAYLTLVQYLGIPGAFETSSEEWPYLKLNFSEDSPKRHTDSESKWVSPLQHTSKTAVEHAASSILVKEKGDVLYRFQDQADSLYVLLDGTAEALVPVETGKRYSESWRSKGSLIEGSIAGGISCFVDIPRRETIKASSKTRWAVFSRRKFSDVGGDDSPIAHYSGVNVLLNISLVMGRALTPLLRLHLGLGLQRVWLRSGDVLYRRGQVSDGMYLVIHGRLRAYTSYDRSSPSSKSDKPLFWMRHRKFLQHGSAQFDFPPGYDTTGSRTPGSSMKYSSSRHRRPKGGENNEYNSSDASGFRVEVGRGESIGELSVLLENDEREHTAICVRDCELVRITPEAFERLCTLFPVIMRKFTAILAKRYLTLVNQISSKGNDGVTMADGHSSQEEEKSKSLVEMAIRSTQPHPVKRLREPSLVPPVKSSVDPKDVPGQVVAQPRGSSTVATIAIVYAGGLPPAPSVVSAFTSSLCQCLRDFGTVIQVNSRTIDRRLGEGTTARVDLLFERARVAAWLSAKEESNRFVVMETDPNCSAWTKMAVQHCDLALLVGQAHSPADFSSVERCIMFAKDSDERYGSIYVPRTFCKRELVILHPDATQPPRNTRDWLRKRPVGWHHHVRLRELGDFGRLSRFIAGKAVGLVLSGGGSRGLAHLGIIRSLEARGIPIDFIGGTSQGAFMAGAYAKALSSTAVMVAAKILSNRIGSTWGVIQSLTLPLISYFSGESFNILLQQALGDTQIEDLWIKYFCVTTNVTKDRMDVHQTGPLWRYARASMTIMGLLPPMLDVDGSILVDGGYVNNLPVDVMRKLCPNVSTVLAVDVENKDNSALENVTNYGDHISGWYLAGKIILSWLGLGEKVHVPSTSLITLKLSYISHTMAIKDILAKAQAQGDTTFLYIQPDVQKFALLDYQKLSEIMTLGYLETESVLDELYVNNQSHELCRYMKPSARARFVLQKINSQKMRDASDSEFPHKLQYRRSESMGHNVSSLPDEMAKNKGQGRTDDQPQENDGILPAGRCTTDLHFLSGTDVSPHQTSQDGISVGTSVVGDGASKQRSASFNEGTSGAQRSVTFSDE